MNRSFTYSSAEKWHCIFKKQQTQQHRQIGDLLMKLSSSIGKQWHGLTEKLLTTDYFQQNTAK